MSNKNDVLWMNNCNAVKRYLFLNKKDAVERSKES